MITVGSVPRESASRVFRFLAPDFRGRRKAIRSLTHTAPEYVFWVFPDGRLHDARDSHRANIPKGYDHICDDEPEYGGFLRGRVVRQITNQLIVVYCRSDALVDDVGRITQFLRAMDQMPIPLDADALVISDNADIYGTLADLRERLPTAHGRRASHLRGTSRGELGRMTDS
jgi:hypothetical protein